MMVRRALPALLTIVGLLGTAPAVAQTSEPSGFDIQRFRTPLDHLGLLDLEWGRLPTDEGWEAVAFLHYVNDPFVLYRQGDDGYARVAPLVSDRLDLDLGGSVVLLPWLQLGLGTRLTLFQTRPEEVPGVDPSLEKLPVLGLGDLRLAPKLSLLKQELHHLDLAFILGASLPISPGRNYLGERSATLTPELALSREDGALRYGLNLAYLLRGRTDVLGLRVDDELQYRLGVGYDLEELVGQKIEAQLALSGAQALYAEEFASPLELLLGAHWDLPDLPFRAHAGFGVGLTHGYGAADFRIFLGLRYVHAWAAPKPDLDADGVLNEQDACPKIAGPVENRGCPDTDGDGDGVVDRLDRCPEKPGKAEDDGCPRLDQDEDGLLDEKDECPTEPGPAENKGCPDQDGDEDGVVDRLDDCPQQAGLEVNRGCPDEDVDGDGKVDREDGCPEQPEDVDGFEDEDGCPDLDNDEDGVVDGHDRCPLEAGIPENHGCPDTDRDGDGVVDRLDNCPDEAGVPEQQGCKKKQLVIIREAKLEILEKVFFQSGKDVIQKRSFALLDNVFEVLKSHPEIGKIQVEGHTDDQGNDAFNKKLSQRRAEAVRTYLLKKGIAEERLEAIGYGEERPVEPNETKEGRAANRRVEFVIPDTRETTTTLEATPVDAEEAAPVEETPPVEATPEE
ncbi:MAG: thrombospondin type 3 repeat-containing protein [Deltaproteobacteria bacterium]|nr:thrombospondin type 3 repeat-containing protein [Deltaproteobacteria bacterium]